MGPYCKYCDQRCFARLPQDTPKKYLDIYKAHGFTSIIIATCAAGQRAEKKSLGVCYDDIVAAIESQKLISEETVAEFHATANRAASWANQLQELSPEHQGKIFSAAVSLAREVQENRLAQQVKDLDTRIERLEEIIGEMQAKESLDESVALYRVEQP